MVFVVVVLGIVILLAMGGAIFHKRPVFTYERLNTRLELVDRIHGGGVAYVQRLTYILDHFPDRLLEVRA
jgi:hypothetical protein